MAPANRTYRLGTESFYKWYNRRCYIEFFKQFINKDFCISIPPFFCYYI